MILYGEDSLIQSLLAAHRSSLQVKDNIPAAALRRLDEKKDGLYRLIVGDDPKILSRGIDFRGHQNGLTLIQAKSAPDTRCHT